MSTKNKLETEIYSHTVKIIYTCPNTGNEVTLPSEDGKYSYYITGWEYSDGECFSDSGADMKIFPKCPECGIEHIIKY